MSGKNVTVTKSLQVNFETYQVVGSGLCKSLMLSEKREHILLCK